MALKRLLSGWKGVADNDGVGRKREGDSIAPWVGINEGSPGRATAPVPYSSPPLHGKCGRASFACRFTHLPHHSQMKVMVSSDLFFCLFVFSLILYVSLMRVAYTTEISVSG